MATMLDCKKIQPLLSEFVDNALDGDTAWKVKLHVSSCAVCEQVAGEIRATASLLSGLPARETSSGFEAALAARLADRVLAPRRVSLWERMRMAWAFPATPVLRPALASAAALAMLVPATLITLRGTHVSPASGPATTKVSVADASGLQSLWDEHAAYSASEPLGDQAGVMLASDLTVGGASGEVSPAPQSGSL